MFRLFFSGSWFFLLWFATSVAGATERPSLAASAVTEAPILDGRVQGDPAWDGASVASSFVQTQPFSGQPSTERTEVRIVFTNETLYVGVVCHDSDPSGIIVSDSRRDASLNDTDSFQVIFDTFQDGQNGFVFGTNAAGIEFDAQVVRGGSSIFGGAGGGRFQGGSAAGFNLNWDGAWQVAASVGDHGWSAEFAIPFRTLRYPGGGDAQRWGLNFQRVIRRRNEASYWAELDHNMTLDRLTEAGTLTDVVPPPQKNLKLIPYALGTARRPPVGDDETDTEEEIGIDLKYSLTPGLTLDATINTDFAQVEVDEQQVNLDRFSLFFPEKRPFFLENAGIFSVGASPTGSRASAQANLFFSRRIGLGPNGEIIPIKWGARVSGKAGRFNVGFLDMQTDDLGGSIAANNYGVARVSREFQNRSSFGGIFINREGTGRLAGDDDYNRTFAIDGVWGIGQNHTISGFAAQTDTPGLDGSDTAYNLRYQLSSPKWRAILNYLEADENFNPEVGFLSRDSFRNASGFVMRVVRPKDLWGLQELRPHVSYASVWDLDDFQESEFIHIDNHWEWRNSWELHTGLNLTKEGVRTAFEIADGVIVPPGDYSHEEAQVVMITNQGAPFSYSNRVTIGGFFGGELTAISQTLRARLGEALTSQLTWSYNNGNLPGGDFDINLGRLRVSYSITTRLLIQALVQYNDSTDQTSANLRLSWLRDANTGLFIVYNEIDEFGNRALFERSDRSLVIKYSYLVDVLGRKGRGRG